MIETTMPSVLQTADDLGFEVSMLDSYCVRLDKGFMHVTVADRGFDGFALQMPGWPVERYRSVVHVMARLRQLSL